MRLEIFLLFYLTSAFAYFQGGGTNDKEQDLFELPLRLKRLLLPLLKQYPHIKKKSISDENKGNNEVLPAQPKHSNQAPSEPCKSESKDLIRLDKERENKHQCREGCDCGDDCPCKDNQRKFMTVKKT